MSTKQRCQWLSRTIEDFPGRGRRGRRWFMRRRLLELDLLERRVNPSAVIYTPTTDVDFAIGSTADVDPGDGRITSGAGAGQVTLRSAIIAANVNVGADSIDLTGGGTYRLTAANSGGINED